MADSKKVYWIGVSFDPDEDITGSEYLSQQALAIEGFLLNRETVETMLSQEGNVFYRTFQNPAVFGSADIIDVWLEGKSRIGFGFVVRGLEEYSSMPSAMKKWFKTIGISMYVFMYEFDTTDPRQRKPRFAGVEEMTSLDII